MSQKRRLWLFAEEKQSFNLLLTLFPKLSIQIQDNYSYLSHILQACYVAFPVTLQCRRHWYTIVLQVWGDLLGFHVTSLFSKIKKYQSFGRFSFIRCKTPVITWRFFNISIIFHISVSWLNLLYAYDFYFWWRDTANQPYLYFITMSINCCFDLDRFCLVFVKTLVKFPILVIKS